MLHAIFVDGLYEGAIISQFVEVYCFAETFDSPQGH